MKEKLYKCLIQNLGYSFYIPLKHFSIWYLWMWRKKVIGTIWFIHMLIFEVEISNFENSLFNKYTVSNGCCMMTKIKMWNIAIKAYRNI